AAKAETNPTSNETRAPCTTPLNTSRPRSSVPNRCAAEGGLSTTFEIANGSWGAIRSAPKATNTSASKNVKPRSTVGRRRKRDQKPDCHLWSPTSDVEALASTGHRLLLSRVSISLVPHPWIKQRV